MDKRVIAISVGNFIHRKGFDILLKATEKLNDEIHILQDKYWDDFGIFVNCTPPKNFFKSVTK